MAAGLGRRVEGQEGRTTRGQEDSGTRWQVKRMVKWQNSMTRMNSIRAAEKRNVFQYSICATEKRNDFHCSFLKPQCFSILHLCC